MIPSTGAHTTGVRGDIRWPAMLVAATAVGLWAIGGASGALSPERRLRQAAEEEARSMAAEHAAFTGAMGVREDRRIEVARGESLASAIIRAGAEDADVTAVLRSVEGIFDSRRVRPGQQIDVYFESDGAAPSLKGVAFRSQPGAAIFVNRTAAGGFNAREVLMPLTFEVSRIAAPVQTTLYDSLIAGGATDREVSAFADAFAYDVDFQRDIRPGDGVELVFERFRDDEGRTVKTGDLLFVSLDVRGEAKSYYRFKRRAGPVDWYDAAGKSSRRALMKTPINGARLSSGFGMRRHPILGYSLLHKGTDFAAPTGTPIMAAGDGVVVRAGGNGAYGNYVRIRHSDGYETAYAHLSRFGAGMRPGATVRQRQIIGYVGSTGRSTGPHLHYEVMYRGAQMNPMLLKGKTGGNLDGADLVAFKEERARIDALRISRQRTVEVDPSGMAPSTVVSASFGTPNADGGLRGGFR